jgi:O-antigen/teichoic acid export membrane protein
MSLLTFLVIGPRLGPEGFGALAALLAIIVLAAPLLTASPEHVIVQRIARGRNVGDAWARSLAVLVSIGPFAAIVMVFAAIIVAPTVSIQAVLMISLGEIVLLGLARVAILAHEAYGASRLGTQVSIVNFVTRGAALAVFVLVDATTIDEWARCHVIASLAAAIHAHWTMRINKRSERFLLRPTTADYQDRAVERRIRLRRRNLRCGLPNRLDRERTCPFHHPPAVRVILQT